MRRRDFLHVLSAALAGAVLDPERLLWVPGQKTFFLPSQMSSELGVALRFIQGWTTSPHTSLRFEMMIGFAEVPFDVTCQVLAH